MSLADTHRDLSLRQHDVDMWGIIISDGDENG